jgi:hypothetical protein
VNEFFPPSKTTSLKNEITKFTQKYDESFGEAWDRFKELLRKCPHHGFSELMQLDTFYNGVSQADQDSLNASAGGNFLSRTTKEALKIIENKSKVRSTRSKPIVSQINAGPSTSSSASQSSTDAKIDKLTEAIQALVLAQTKKVSFPQHPPPAEVKKVEVCVTYGGPHAYYNCTATDGTPYEAHVVVGSQNQGGNQYRPPMDPSYRPQHHYPGPPGFNQNQNVQNRGQNQNRVNQGFQNQGFQHQNQGNFNRNQGQGNFNSGYFHGNNNPHQGNFQNQGPNPNNRAPNIPNPNQAIVPTGPSSDELLKQFMKSQEELNKLLFSQISDIKKSLNDRPSGSGTTLPSNTIANPRGDAKAITTRSGASYDEPAIPTTPSSFPSKVVEREPEVTKDKVQPTCSRSTAHVQPQVIPETRCKPGVVFEPP